jgi:tRNA(Ile)-lysidine synthase
VPLTADDGLAQAVRAAFVSAPLPDRLGVAVSGGGDSMALLHLLADWCREGGPQVAAVTVNHGLRDEAAAEAALVARVCAGLGVPHDVVDWNGREASGNVMDAARRARLRLVGEWADRSCYALAHLQVGQSESIGWGGRSSQGNDGKGGIRDLPGPERFFQ